MQIVIPNWTPTSINTLLGSHWAKARKLKQADQQVIAVHAYNAKITKATGKRKVNIEVTKSGRGRLPDADNLLKSCMDALKNCGYLIDDSNQWVEWEQPIIQRGNENKTVITLIDILPAKWATSPEFITAKPKSKGKGSPE